jgi:biotin carboxyl carrier protein
VEVALREAAAAGALAPRAGTGGPFRLTAPMPGRVVKVLVEAGDTVAEGQGLVVMEAMKMENELRAPRAGRVKELPARERQAVEMGALLVVLE